MKTQTVTELEAFMTAQGFLNIDTTFVGMWELFIVIFVKKDLRKEVHDVRK